MKRILKKLPNYKRIGQAASMLLTYLLALIGAVGLAITIINPVNLWWSISPIETKLFVIKYSTVINYLEYLQSYYWYAIGAFTATFALAYIIHIRSVKQVVRGIKATPRAILYSPVTTYKELVLFRDWLFEKIEYLNSESAKWRRFFNVIKSPYSLLRSFGLSPQLAIALLGIGTASGTAVAVNEVIQERSFSNSSPGIYSAPSDLPDEELEKRMAWRKDNPDDNTLRIVVGAVPVETISISDVSINNYTNSTLPSGKTEALLIDGKTVGIDIGELVYERVTCKQMTVSNVNAHKIVIKENISDGQSIAQTSGNQRDLRISGGYDMAKELKTEGGRFDRIWLDTDTATSTPKINKLILSNIVTKGGTCDLKNLNVGLLTIQYNATGHDQNFATKEFTVATTTKANIWDVTNNIEVLLTEPPTQ
tara:strand:+ start:521 stop:1789 length:1269 start_codon:yes stop_codon:yes gene_type:complete